MLFEDYKREVASDAVDAIERGDYDYLLPDADADEVSEEMWTDDSITGNASGSYTFNTWQATQNVGELLFDDDFIEECKDLCIDLGDLLKQGPEAIDVTARCLALSWCYDDIRDAWEARCEGVTDDAA